MEDHGYRVISLVEDNEIDESMFYTHAYFREKEKRRFAEIVARKLVEMGIIG